VQVYARVKRLGLVCVSVVNSYCGDMCAISLRLELLYSILIGCRPTIVLCCFTAKER